MKNKRKYYVKYWLPLIIYCLLIFFQSFMGIPTGWLKGFDKPIHFFVYAFLGILIYRAFTTVSKRLNIFLIIIFSVVVSTLIGLTDEVFQIFSPSRTIDRLDILYDCAGSVAGIFLFLFVQRVFSNNKEPE